MPIRYLDEETPTTSGRIKYLDEVPAEGDTLDKAVAVATEVAEGSTGWGTELGAFGSQLGASVYELMNTDKPLAEVMQNFNKTNLDAAFERIRGSQDRLEESDPILSDAAAGVGVVSGFGIPAASLSKGSRLAKSAIAAAEGVAYGAGSDEDRAIGAAIGGTIGGSLGYGAARLSDYIQRVKVAKEADAATQAEAMSELVEEAGWEDVGDVFNKFDEYAVGVSDAIRRKVSPEVGGRVQRADEMALRMRNKDTKEILENEPMQNVIRAVEEDKTLKGMVLDFARRGTDQGSLLKYVRDEYGPDESRAFSRYLNWSDKYNRAYNKKIGNSNLTTDYYLHTQVKGGSNLSGTKEVPQAKEGIVNLDDDLNVMPQDKAELDRSRGLASDGDVRVEEYENPLLTNANRVFNNQRLLQLKEKLGVKDLSGGPDALMDAIESRMQEQGINALSSRDARNAVAHLIKGQNKNANSWLRAYQNSVYGATLAGPKSALLNFHDIPVALWNNGVANARGLTNRTIRNAADVERLGIDNQNVGEFVQEVRNSSATDLTKGEKAQKLTKAVTDKLMKVSFFADADRISKNRVLRIAGQDAVGRAKQGTLSERWGTYFDAEELVDLESAINRTNGDVTKMSKKEAGLFDEVLTLSLGQQQLISAAGRPQGWLMRPNLRPLYMMRGFAIKHNALLSEKILKKLRNGDKKGAAKEAAAYLALPGTGYAGLNLARQEAAGSENYEASGEEFMYSLMDSVLGPVALNTVGLGSSYERERLSRNPVEAIMIGMLPPGGYTETFAKVVSKAIKEEDGEELAGLVTELPIYKQWESLIND